MYPTTPAELGYRLPIGVETPNGGLRSRAFGFKPWRAADERHVGRVRDKNRGMPPGEFTSHVLAYFLTGWGNKSFEGLSESERRYALVSSYLADVLYAWVALRREVMGDELAISITCPICHKVFPFNADLSTLPVIAATDEEELRTPCTLKHGFSYSGRDVHVVTMEPSRWSMFENFGADGFNIGAIKLRSIAASIVALEDQEARISAEMLDLTKRDLEDLYAYVNDKQPGPDLRIATACSACGMPFNRSFSWGYESFFSTTASSDGGA